MSHGKTEYFLGASNGALNALRNILLRMRLCSLENIMQNVQNSLSEINCLFLKV